MPDRLQGHVSVVTGTATGIGRTIALRFGAEGAHVLCADIDPFCEAAVAQADVQRLPAAAQGEVDAVGRVGSLRADGHAALELGHRPQIAEMPFGLAGRLRGLKHRMSGGGRP